MIGVSFLAIMGIVGYDATNQLAKSNSELYNQRILPMEKLTRSVLVSKYIKEKNLDIVSGSLSSRDKADDEKMINKAWDEIGGLLASFRESNTDESLETWSNELLSHIMMSEENKKIVRDLANKGEAEKAKNYYAIYVKPHEDEADKLLVQMIDRSQLLADKQIRADQERVRKVMWMILVITAGFCFVSIWGGRRIANKITKPINDIVKQVEQVSAGDLNGLSGYQAIATKNEIGRLSMGFFQMSQTLQNYLQALTEKNAEICKMANLDALTGLPNRRYFMDRMKNILQECGEERVALMFIDMDRFKEINDTRGHNIGDQILEAVAKRMISLLPTIDSVNRLGGDEFTIIYRGFNDVDQVTTVAEQVMCLFQEPFVFNRQIFHLSCSIGISIYPLHGQTVVSLLQAADTAMYTAKLQKRNSFHYYSDDMRQKILQKVKMEETLHFALEKHLFHVYYQPRVLCDSGQIVGVEALLRLQQDGKFISPAEFIPVAEETGLILQLGEWVLYQACRQNKEWQQAGYPPVRISVNVSPIQFNHSGFLGQVIDVLEKTGLDPEWLELEITESSLMDKVDAAKETLMVLKRMGIKVAMDDFGTGYSSLAYLKQFKIDYLKVDKTFIDEISQKSKQLKIVQAIIGLGKSLNMKIVAEGVEGQEQLKFLQLHNCDEIQGFLFSKAIPANDFELLLKAGGYIVRAETSV